jgi:Kef-type K+ transport system membrane component KefB
MKILAQRILTVLGWGLHMFDPPPLQSMNRTQKVGRIFLVTITILVTCILTAMGAAVVLYLFERGRQMLGSVPELAAGLEIILAGAAVNAICVIMLFEIRKIDRKLMAGTP